MRRFTSVTVTACLLVLPALALAQAPPPPAAASKKYVPPVKGLATIEVIQMPSKRVGSEMVTVIKVRNTSKGSINLLKVDEYWYDATAKIVGGGPYNHRKAPIQPGEIVEITLKSPWNAQMRQNQLLFRHANGDVKATPVKAFK